MLRSRLVVRATFLVVAFAVTLSRAEAQEHHHTASASGLPHGVPIFCAEPTVKSLANGAWSSPSTWSTGRVPGADDAVLIETGTSVTYDVSSDVSLRCVRVNGRLAFDPSANTRIKVGTVLVMEGAVLEIGTAAHPIDPARTAEIIIANRPIDRATDPEQFGTSLIGLGTVTIHGAPRTPTFVRLAREPLAGQSAVVTERAVSGWRPGDRLVVPDTRQLKASGRGRNENPQWEEPVVGALGDGSIGLVAALAFDHKGARNADGVLEFLPHVGNLSRNVIIRSENPAGTRGHVMFVTRANVDIRYATFRDLGRTTIKPLDLSRVDEWGVLQHFGTNQIGRYALHFHHVSGPTPAPANGYQFTAIGNTIEGAIKWAVVVHASHYGLVADNVVYNTAGAGIVTEDGSESFNVIERNFAVRAEGEGESEPARGYGGASADSGAEGSAFWLRGPNNYFRNNVAANATAYGFSVAAGRLPLMPVPLMKGGDVTKAGEFTMADMNATPLLEFSGNEAYGAIQAGLTVGWEGTVKNFRAWHPSRYGFFGFPLNRLEFDTFVVRGDRTALNDVYEDPTGLWFGDYVSKTVAIRNADIQGTRTGITSPFFMSSPGAGQTDGEAVIENSVIRTQIGVAVATGYARNAEPGTASKKAIIRNTRLDPLSAPPSPVFAPLAISLNDGVPRRDTTPREPVYVFDFNQKPGDNFRVFYSPGPQTSASCGAARPGVDGVICSGDK